MLEERRQSEQRNRFWPSAECQSLFYAHSVFLAIEVGFDEADVAAGAAAFEDVVDEVVDMKALYDAEKLGIDQ